MRYLWLITPLGTCFVIILFYSFTMNVRWTQMIVFWRPLDPVGDPSPIYIQSVDLEAQYLHTLLNLLHQRSTPLPLISMVNAAYTSLAHSWLCNTRYMEGIHNITVIITTDREAYHDLYNKWVDEKSLNGPAMFYLPLDDRLSRGHAFDQLGYRSYLLQRIHLLSKLVDEGISFVLFEVDAVWLHNPLPQLHRIVSTDTSVDVWAAHVGASYFYAMHNMSVNFMLVKSSPRSIALWQELDHVLTTQINNTYEQEELDKMCKARVAHVKCQVLPYQFVADGTWYLDKDRYNEAPTPAVINNNYIRGINSKVNRAKDYGHWFWRESETECDEYAINKIVTPDKI